MHKGTNISSTLFASLIVIMVASIGLCGCNKSDDLDTIFEGRFKITSYRHNAQYENDLLKELNNSKDVYYIVFSGKTFSGMLSEGTSIAGTWDASGSDRTFHIDLTSTNNSDNKLNRMIINILKNATAYSGDHNVVRIKQDNENFIDMSSGDLL